MQCMRQWFEMEAVDLAAGTALCGLKERPGPLTLQRSRLLCAVGDGHTSLGDLQALYEAGRRAPELDVAAPAAAATGNSATRLAPRPASHAATQPAEDPLLHLSFGDPAQSASPSTPGVDPALDLHFDPAVGIPSAPHRNGRN